jgi:hypothetical protein
MCHVYHHPVCRGLWLRCGYAFLVDSGCDAGYALQWPSAVAEMWQSTYPSHDITTCPYPCVLVASARLLLVLAYKLTGFQQSFQVNKL